MDVMLTGEDQSQADQPSSLAEVEFWPLQATFLTQQFVANNLSSTIQTVQNLTSGGSVASDAEKLAKPILPYTEVALVCSAWGNHRTFLQQSAECLVHACMHAAAAVTVSPGICVHYAHADR
eukprot:391894-Pelagomonas_calceolata.AAC.1